MAKTPFRKRFSTYRGFKILKRVSGVYRVDWLAKGVNFYLPRHFEFHGSLQLLHQYIDALVTREALRTQKIEDSGVVQDLEYDDSQNDELKDRPMVTISPERLLEILLLQDPLEIPAEAAIRFSAHDGRWWPEVVIAGLLDKGLLRESELPTKSVIDIAPHEIPSAFATTGLNAQRDAVGADGNFQMATASADAPPSPMSRHTVRAINHRHYHELLDIVQDQQGTYYQRQLVRNGKPFWLGTSWSINGPWACYWEDERLMQAMEAVSSESD